MSSKDIKELNFNGTNLPIRRFHLEWMVPNPSIVLIAKRGSGKSWIARALLKHFNDIPGGVVISKTEKLSLFYGKFIPDSYIHYEFKTEIIEKLLYRQTTIKEKALEKQKRGKKLDPRVFLVMDDCLADKGNWGSDKNVMEVLFNGRHYHIMYILTMQFPLGIKPELRVNFDYIFILADNQNSNQEKIYKHYAGIFPTFQLFKMVFMQLTADFGCMVLTNRETKMGITDNVFWYKADNVENIKIGCSQYRQFHQNNYDDKWKKKEKIIDINKILTNKKKVQEMKIEKVE